MMCNEGWHRDRVRQRSYVADGYWCNQAVATEHLLRTLVFTPSGWLLDLGSDTCWASKLFATDGLNVAALDIALWELQGLYTADHFIEDGTSYF